MKNNIVNSVQLIGFVGGDPTSKNFESGKKVANYFVATNFSYKDSNGKKITKTLWHKITCWDSQADFVTKHLKKGNHVLVKGSLDYRSYENSEGQKSLSVEIIQNQLLILSKLKDLKDIDVVDPENIGS